MRGNFFTEYTDYIIHPVHENPAESFSTAESYGFACRGYGGCR